LFFNEDETSGFFGGPGVAATGRVVDGAVEGAAVVLRDGVVVEAVAVVLVAPVEDDVTAPDVNENELGAVLGGFVESNVRPEAGAVVVLKENPEAPLVMLSVLGAVLVLAPVVVGAERENPVEAPVAGAVEVAKEKPDDAVDGAAVVAVDAEVVVPKESPLEALPELPTEVKENEEADGALDGVVAR
jgi:hypothetical protein